MSGVNATGHGVHEVIIIGPGGVTPPVSVSQAGLSGQPVTTLVALTNANQAYPLPGTAVASRRNVIVQAWEGNTLPVFIGGAGVTARVYGAAGAATDGFMLEVPTATKQGRDFERPLGTGAILYAVASAVGQKVVVYEEPYA